VRNYAQNQENSTAIDASSEDIEQGLKSMKAAYHANGQKLYQKL